jgi:monoamine oxidase
MTDVDVVIIGGGAAGIAAARRLSEHEVATLLIEAGSRLGGRARTERAGSCALDLGCGWLHSADRNPWAAIAGDAGMTIDRREGAWSVQYRELGFAKADQAAARQALNAWIGRLAADPSASDSAADALPVASEWDSYLRAMAGFISGVAPEYISAADFTAYDLASTGRNWRVPTGYGTLVAGSLPPTVPHRLSTAAERIDLDARGVTVTTSAGTVRASAAILTVSTAVLAGGAIHLPRQLDPWREAASFLPLGRNEKLFLAIAAGAPFEDETHLLGNPRDASTGAYYIRPFGWPVIECFLGGDGAARMAREGTRAGYAHAIDELSGLFGSRVRQQLRPVIASEWTNSPLVGGGYSPA